MVDVCQQVVLVGGRHQFGPDQRLVTHDVKRAAETVVSILLEVGFGHFATHDSQLLVVVDILSGLAVIVNDEAYFQFLPCCENGLQGSLDTVQINVVGQRHDTRDVVLHHFRIFHVVIENAQL